MIKKQNITNGALVISSSLVFLTYTSNALPNTLLINQSYKNTTPQSLLQINLAHEVLMQDLASRLDAEPNLDVKNEDNFWHVFHNGNYYGIYAIMENVSNPIKHIAIYQEGETLEQIANEDSLYNELPLDVQQAFQRLYIVNAPLPETVVDDVIYNLILEALSTNNPKLVIDYEKRIGTIKESWSTIKKLYEK